MPTKHAEIQKRLKSKIQSAILDVGSIEGSDESVLTNTDVIEALLEITGLWASIHGFEDYEPIDLAFKHAMTIKAHIERFEPLMKSGKLPFKIIPRRQVN